MSWNWPSSPHNRCCRWPPGGPESLQTSATNRMGMAHALRISQHISTQVYIFWHRKIASLASLCVVLLKRCCRLHGVGLTFPGERLPIVHNAPNFATISALNALSGPGVAADGLIIAHCLLAQPSSFYEILQNRYSPYAAPRILILL
jgi:hypothetical protein